MIRNLFLAGATLAFVTVMVPKASADQFTLNVDYCSTACIPTGGSAGTVTLTQVGTSTDILVQLNAGYVFHDQGLTSFSFNNTNTNISTPVVTNAGGTTWTFQKPATNSDGAGNFMYGLECAAGSNGCSGSTGVLEFTVANSTVLSFETTNGGASHVDFAANVANTSVSGCTGVVGGGNGLSQTTYTRVGSTGTGTCTGTPVPESTSVLLLGTALLFAGKMMKMKLLVS
jgi:hypothetical protein